MMLLGLDQLATVYTGDDYATTAQANLKCRLVLAVRTGEKVGEERAEEAGNGRLLWDPAYAMPENCQIAIEGVRYNPVPGTFMAPRGPLSNVIYRRCDVIRAG